MTIAAGLAGSVVGCSNGGCPDGFVSNGSFCEPLPTDAGPDAAAVDAGPSDDVFVVGADAVLPDAFVVPDAWAPDAWTPFDVCTPARVYADLDGDGFGDPTTGRDDCLERGGVEDATDCDDSRAEVNPDATEICNGLDDECDTLVDDGVLLTFYVDADGDTYGTSVSIEACTMPSGHAARSGDCNDACATCNPGASETCDGLDNDCDGTVDDGVLLTFYVDGDGDTYGTSVSIQACTLPAGHATRSGDCNDACATCNPGASEACDGLDNDCDALIDDGVLTTFYVDADGDTYGTAVTTQACTLPGGYAARSGDCNDACMTCNPGRTETCDGLDNDCDTLIDDGVLTTFYRDADGDMRGLASMSTAACTAPAGYVTSSDDCNDGCTTCYPGRSESCDGLDNNCNTTIDEGVLNSYYRDCDVDNFTVATATLACSVPARPAGCSATGVVWRGAPTATDCADEDNRAFPGQTSYFGTAITGPHTVPDRDFNCDGSQTRQYVDVALCLDDVRPGWQMAPVPACGVYGWLDLCTGPATFVRAPCR